jgi:L-lactate dehydrogenase complex protein LldG
MNTYDNPGRQRVLERIRTALRDTGTPASAEASFSKPAGTDRSVCATRPEEREKPTPVPYRAMFEPVTDALARFQQEAKANLMECLLTADAAASGRELAKVLDSLPAGEIFVHDHPRLRRLLESAVTSRPVRWSSQGAPSEQSQATVTLVEAVIAQTGSILVSAACGGRGASVVAPCHIAVASVSQVVPDLEIALRQATARGILKDNSFACVISGSSRTADIEKILVQGAHGPRRLVVILET